MRPPKAVPLPKLLRTQEFLIVTLAVPIVKETCTGNQESPSQSPGLPHPRRLMLGSSADGVGKFAGVMQLVAQ